MMCHYPDLGGASDLLGENSNQSEELPDQYGISVLVTQTSFCEGSSGDFVKRRLFSQARQFTVVINFLCIEYFLVLLHLVYFATVLRR